MIIVVRSQHLILVVTEFTKKTGDYPSLSATDIRLIALTYQLEAQHVGTDHIKTRPDAKVQVCTGASNASLNVQVARFYTGGDNNDTNSRASTSRSGEHKSSDSSHTAEESNTQTTESSNSNKR